MHFLSILIVCGSSRLVSDRKKRITFVKKNSNFQRTIKLNWDWFEKISLKFLYHFSQLVFLHLNISELVRISWKICSGKILITTTTSAVDANGVRHMQCDVLWERFLSTWQKLILSITKALILATFWPWNVSKLFSLFLSNFTIYLLTWI